MGSNLEWLCRYLETVGWGGRTVLRLSIPYTDVLTAGVLPVLRNLEDPELQRLAEALPTTVLSSRANSTTNKYLGAFKRWKLWAEARQGAPVFPVQDIHLALYLQHLGESVESRAAAEEAVHALTWLHQVAGLPSVGDSPLVRVTLARLGRRLARPKVRKEPVTADMLRAMVDSVGQEPSLSNVRLLAVCLVAFAGFMRCDELLKLHCSDVAFGITITIVSSKTDQYREGSSLVIARTGTLTCPVAMMEKYFFMGSLCTLDQGTVFRAIDSTKNGQRLRKFGGISYTRLRELLLEKIEQLGMDPKAFGCIVYGRVVLLRQRGPVWLIVCSNVMAAGGQNQLRMVM